MRTTLSRRLLGALLPLVLPGLALGGVAFLVHRERVAAERESQASAVAQGARVAERKAVLARGELGPVLELCRAGWREVLGLYHEPVALAWTRRGLDGYFLVGSAHDSLRQVRCDAQGVSRGPRVRHPLQDRLPAEAPAESEPTAAEAWQLALAQLSARPLDQADLALELLAHPLAGAALQRRWREGQGGARATVQPADAPAFSLLVAAPQFRPAEDEMPPPLQALPRQHWLAQADAAFDVVAHALPAGARIAELTLSEDEIELSIASPTPAFEGKPKAPYGDKKFDEYGIADMDWWYPREIPGFGCPAGQPLALVRAAFAEARARFAGRPLASAWFSCSTAYSDGRNGVWHLQPN